jgi:hypothetical protein
LVFTRRHRQTLLQIRRERLHPRIITIQGYSLPKLLRKDHKKKDKWGNFPTKLVITATNFTSAFPKLGYLGIKKIFDDEKVNYMKKTIVQASHAKGILEKLFINKSSHTVFSLDIESF